MSTELIQAIQLLKEKKWVDLTHTFGEIHLTSQPLMQLNLIRYSITTKDFLHKAFDSPGNMVLTWMRRSILCVILVIWINSG